MKRWLALLAFAGAFAAAAQEAQPLAEDPLVEQRMIAIASELRCLVCQNESLAGSQADLAKDLREEVRRLIKAGKSDDEVREFLVTRYGDFVLYRPRVTPTTYLLWGGPFLLLALGVVVLIRYLRRRERMLAPSTLSEEERRRAEALLEEHGQ